MRNNKYTISQKIFLLIGFLVCSHACIGQSNSPKAFSELIHQAVHKQEYPAIDISAIQGSNQENTEFKNQILSKPIFENNSIEITGFKIDNVEDSKATIVVKRPNETKLNPPPEEVKVGDKFPYGTYFEIPKNIEVKVLTPKGYNFTCTNGVKILTDVETNQERSRLISGDCFVSKEFDRTTSSSVASAKKKKKSLFKRFIDRSLNWFSGGDTGQTAGMDGTVIRMVADSSNFKVRLEDGNASFYDRKKIVLNEKISLDSLELREIFITEISDLSTEFQDSLDQDKELILDTENQIDAFFEQQLAYHRRILRSGPNSNLAYKLLEMGIDSTATNQDSLSVGIVKYQEAMENGEIDRDHFIQAALILTEGHFRKGNSELRMSWLEAALYFIKREQEYNESNFSRFENLNDFELARGFGEDLVVSTEYHTWAYTLKLMLTGCLENEDHNPIKWRNYSKNLKCKLKSKDLQCSSK